MLAVMLFAGYHKTMPPTDEFSIKRFFYPLTSLKAIHILIIVGILVFANAFFNGFVWDDIPFIVNNQQVHHPMLFSAFTQNYFNNSGYYRPIPAIYFSTLYSLFGETTFFYHVVQILLHIVCSCLLFFAFKKFFRVSIALFLSLLFLIHPIQVESVVYIGAAQSELFFICGIVALTILLYKKITTKSLFIVSILLLFGLLVKETAICWAVVIGVWIFFKEREWFKKYLVGLSAICALYVFLRVVIGGVGLHAIGYAPIAQLSLLQRIFQMPYIIWYYFGTCFFPARLAIDQQWIGNSSFLQVCGDSIVFGSILVLGIVLQKKKSLSNYIFFLVWFLSGFFFLLQIFPLDMTVADRWFYFPFAGLLGVIGCGLELLNIKKLSWLWVVIATLIIGGLSIRAVVRNTNWFSLRSLYAHDSAIESTFDNELNYGVVLYQNGDMNDALNHLLIADKEYSTEFTLQNTGLLYLLLHDKKNSYDYLTKAYHAKSYVLPPHHHQTITYDSYARWFMIYGEYKIADTILSAGVTDYPDEPTLWYLKAINNYFRKDLSQAIADAQKSYTLAPGENTHVLFADLQKNIPLNIKLTN